MPKEIHVSELPSLAGQDIGTSDWFEVTQEKVNMFAEATGDHQWIHIDVERAKKEMPTGGTIAHGYMTLSLIPMFMPQIMSVSGVQNGINYGCNKVRFTNMVPVGSRVRMHMKLANVEEKGGGYHNTYEVTMELEGAERPAMVAEVVMITYPA